MLNFTTQMSCFVKSKCSYSIIHVAAVRVFHRYCRITDAGMIIRLVSVANSYSIYSIETSSNGKLGLADTMANGCKCPKPLRQLDTLLLVNFSQQCCWQLDLL